jgi:SAM-dependent methyltransferase
VERLGVRPHHRVLEVGFGGGIGLRTLLDRKPTIAAAIDISEEMVAHARLRFRNELAEGRLVAKRGSVSDIPFEDRAFDRALSVHTIYFWPDSGAGLGELNGGMRPGGVLMLATAAREFMETLPYTRQGFQLFSEEDLASGLRDAGFADVSVARAGGWLFSAGRVGG